MLLRDGVSGGRARLTPAEGRLVASEEEPRIALYGGGSGGGGISLHSASWLRTRRSSRLLSEIFALVYGVAFTERPIRVCNRAVAPE